MQVNNIQNQNFGSLTYNTQTRKIVKKLLIDDFRIINLRIANSEYDRFHSSNALNLAQYIVRLKKAHERADANANKIIQNFLTALDVAKHSDVAVSIVSGGKAKTITANINGEIIPHKKNTSILGFLNKVSQRIFAAQTK